MADYYFLFKCSQFIILQQVSDEQEFGAVREPLLTQKHSNMNSSDKEVLTDEGQLSIDDNPEKEVFDSNEVITIRNKFLFIYFYIYTINL